MNFYLNLIIFNPLEALLLILFVSLSEKDKINIKKLPYCFVLGCINLLLQETGNLINNNMYKVVYDVIVSIVFLSFTLQYVYGMLSNKPIRPSRYFYSCLFNYISLFISVIIIDYFTKLEIWFPTSENLPSVYNMIVVDVLIKILQFIMLFIILKGERFYEKSVKEIGD